MTMLGPATSSDTHLQSASDTLLAGAAVSSPWWMYMLKDGLTWFMLVGGAVLLVMRIIIAWHTIQKARRDAQPQED